MEALDTLYLQLEATLQDIAVATDQGDERLVNKAISLLLDLNRRVSRLDDADAKQAWTLRLERSQRRLQVATGHGATDVEYGTVVLQDVEEGVGEIDGLLNSMKISSTVDKVVTRQVPREEYLAWQGRKFKKVIRSQKGDHDGKVRSVGRPSLGGAPEGHDVVLGKSETIAVEGAAVDNDTGTGNNDNDGEGDGEVARYKPHRVEPLRVEIPVLLPLSGHAMMKSTSHGSNDSTVARQGYDGRRSVADSESGESITSPDNADEANSFRRK